MSIVNASVRVIDEIQKMLPEEDLQSRNLRIAARIDLDGDKIGRGFQLFQSELTLNDQIQAFEGFNIIVANILLQMYGSFTLTCVEKNGKTRINIIPERSFTSQLYKGQTLGTAKNI